MNETMDAATAAKQLAKSERGRRAMADLLKFLENGGIGLDCFNQEAILTLLVGAWHVPMEVREALEAYK